MKKHLLPALLLLSALIFAQPTSWKVTGIGGGGAFFRPSINPGNANEYYVPTDMGSFFHTTNYGQSYTELSFLQLTGGSLGVIRFTNNANILYGVGGGGAVYKTINGGATWTIIPCISGSSNPNVQENVVSLFVDYNNPLHLAFATVDGTYFSGDGGITLIDITQTTPAYQYISGALFDVNNIYLGTPGGVLVSTNGGVSFSKAALTGLTAGYDIVGFATAKSGSTVRFFCSTLPTGTPTDQIYGSAGGWQNTYLNNIYSLDYNLGTVWTANSNGVTLPTSTSCYPCDYIVWMGMAANDINTVYAGGVNGNSQPMLVKTSNAGANWSEVFTVTNNQNINTGYMGYQGDRFQWYDGFSGMDVCQTNSNIVVLSNMGCVHTTSNGGTSWDQAYVNVGDQNPMNAPTPKGKLYRGIGIENTTNWLATWVDANNMVYSLTDIGCMLSPDAGTNWKFANFTYNTMYCVLKHATGTLYGATSNIHDLYTNGLQDQVIDNSAYSQGEVMYSTDNGLNWSTVHDFSRPVYWIALDKNNPNKMYASVVNHAQGLGGIYVTSDLQNGASSTWTKISNPPRTEGHPAKIVTLADGKMVCTFSCRQTDYSATPAGKFTKSAGVFIYDPIGNSWTDVTDLTSLNPISGTNTGTMGWWCNDIYVDPNDATENTWYVGVSAGWGWTDASGNTTPNDLGALRKTTDRGTTWTTLLSEANGLSLGSGVFSCAIDPNNANQMFITTTRDGLWMSNNINGVTPTFTQVASFQFGFPLRVLFNPYNTYEMWVTTFGNGIHVGTLPGGSSVNEIANSTTDFNFYPNPSNEIIHVLFGTGEEKNISVLNSLGEEVKNIYCNSSSVEIKISDLANGVYFIKCGNSCKKLMVNK